MLVFKAKHTWFELRLASLCPNALQIMDDLGFAWVILSFSSQYKAAQETPSCMT